MTTLRVGARGSDLSLAQTRWLIQMLRAARPDLACQIVIIETHGDQNQGSPLDGLWPPGGFVKRIEQALLEGEIDLAVHSHKDVLTEPTPGLTIAAIPEREAPGDVLLTREPAAVDALPPGFVVGTSSPRRTHQIGRHAPQVTPEPIRGNVPTRLEKLMAGRYDGVVLAAAGLARLGVRHEHRLDLPLDQFPPAPGQGALAAQAREGSAAAEHVTTIDHLPTRLAVNAERAFLRATGGGCHAALGAYATVEGETLTLRGQLFQDDRCLAKTVTGPASDPEAIGRRLAREMGVLGAT